MSRKEVVVWNAITQKSCWKLHKFEKKVEHQMPPLEDRQNLTHCQKNTGMRLEHARGTMMTPVPPGGHHTNVTEKSSGNPNNLISWQQKLSLLKKSQSDQRL